MPQTKFQRVTNLSNFNWKGWILLVLTIAAMFGSIVAGVSQSGVGDFDNKGGRKILGVIIAFVAFGAFVLIASAMHKLGHSIYKKGLDPFADPTSGTSFKTVTEAGNDENRDAGDIVHCDAGDATEIGSDLATNIVPTDLL
jgi:hypothetical protein